MQLFDSHIFILNEGSSNIKFALYPKSEYLEQSLHGKIDRIGLSDTKLTFNGPSKNLQGGFALAASRHESARPTGWTAVPVIPTDEELMIARSICCPPKPRRINERF